MLSTPATTKRGTSSARGASVAAATAAVSTARATPIVRKGAEPAAEPVGDSSRADARGDREDIDRGEHGARGMPRHVAVLVEEEDDEGREPDLGHEIEA